MASFILQLDQPLLEVEKDLQLSVSDHIRDWLLQTMQEDPSATDASISVSLGGTQAKLTLASITMDLPARSNRPALAFSTASLAGNFSDRSLPSLRTRQPLLVDSGFYGVHSFLCLGLVPNSAPWTMEDVFLQAGVDSSTSQGSGAALGAVLGKLGGSTDVEFALKRGMIWFLPDEDYLTIQRLEWTLNVAAEQSLQDWCSEWMPGNIVIQNPTIVSRRECSRIELPDNLGLYFKHELLFMFDVVREGIDPAHDYRTYLRAGSQPQRWIPDADCNPSYRSCKCGRQ